MTNKNKQHVVYSLFYVGKKKQRRRSFILKSVYEMDFSLFSFSSGVLVNIHIIALLT